MSDECHAVLKAYAGFFGITMGEVLYMYARQEIQQHSVHCKFVEGLLEGQAITVDKRVAKSCWGHACLICDHAAHCKCGLTDETFKPMPLAKQYLKEDSSIRELYNT